MRLLAHRRDLVVWSRSAAPASRRHARRLTRARRIRRWARIGVLLAAVGTLRLARAVRPRWRPTLAGMVLTATGVILRTGPGSVALIPGMLFLVDALLTPGYSKEDRTRRADLERELGEYSTQAQRCDLEAALERYPDRLAGELRDILARQGSAGPGRPPFAA